MFPFREVYKQGGGIERSLFLRPLVTTLVRLITISERETKEDIGYSDSDRVRPRNEDVSIAAMADG